MALINQPKRWIVDKDARSCSYRCDVPEARVTVKITDAVTGAFHKSCSGCGREEDGQLSRYKERRACKGCQDVRDVTVTVACNREREFAKDYCAICELEISAAHHAATAKAFFARARRLREEKAGKVVYPLCCPFHATGGSGKACRDVPPVSGSLKR